MTDFLSLATKTLSPFQENKLYLAFSKEFANGSPKAYGLFHLIWFGVFILIATLMIIFFKNPSKGNTKLIFFSFWLILFIVELLKQIYGSGRDFSTWKNHPEFIPLMLCSMPLYIIPIYLLIPSKYEKASNAFLSYLSVFNLWCGLFVMFYPGDVFIANIFISNHTMIYHGILMTLGLWTAFRKIVKFNLETFMWAGIVFIAEYSLITMGNEIIYQLKDKTNYWPNLFNMSHRKPSPFFSDIPGVKDLKPWMTTILYVPATFFGAFTFYTIIWGMSLPMDLLEKAISKRIKIKKAMIAKNSLVLANGNGIKNTQENQE